jgi:hypothetical protein
VQSDTASGDDDPDQRGGIFGEYGPHRRIRRLQRVREQFPVEPPRVPAQLPHRLEERHALQRKGNRQNDYASA